METRRAHINWQVACLIVAASCSSPEDENLLHGGAGAAGKGASAGRAGSTSTAGTAGAAGRPASGGGSGSGGRSGSGGTNSEAGEGAQPAASGGQTSSGGSSAGADVQAGRANGGTAGDAPAAGTGGSSGAASGGRAGSPTVTDGPIRISENGRYLTDADANPLLIFGEAAWNLGSQLSVAEQNAYLDDRAARGVNAIAVMLLSRYQDGDPNDADGVPPFTTPGDYATFNPLYFEKVADVVARAGERGMLVFLSPVWAGYDSAQGFYDTMVQNGDTKLNDYGRAVGGMFRELDNIVWIIGGDMRPPIETPLFDALSAGIRAVDDRHLLTSHWNFAPGDTPSGDWEDIVSCYDWDTGVQYPQIRSEYDENDAPVILLEALYELNTAFGVTTKILRMQTIQALLFGAKGAFFGHEGIWHLGSTSSNLGSQSQGHAYDLDSIGIRHQSQIFTFFAQRAWQDLVPDLTNLLVTQGRGTYGESGYAGVARTPDGTLAVAYLPDGGTVSVDLALLGVPLEARWFDPTDGSYQSAGSFAGAEVASLTSPAQNSAGDADFILVFESN